MVWYIISTVNANQFHYNDNQNHFWGEIMKQALKYLTLLIIPFILIKSYHIFESESLVIAMIVLYGLFDFRYPFLFIPSLIISPSVAVTSIILIMIGLAVLLRRFYSKNLYFRLGTQPIPITRFNLYFDGYFFLPNQNSQLL